MAQYGRMSALAMKHDVGKEQAWYNEMAGDVETAASDAAAAAQSQGIWGEIGNYLVPFLVSLIPGVGQLSTLAQMGIAAGSSGFGTWAGQEIAGDPESLGIDPEDYVTEGRVGGGGSWYWGKEGADEMEKSIDKINESIDTAKDDLTDAIWGNTMKKFVTKGIDLGVQNIGDIDVTAGLVQDASGNWIDPGYATALETPGAVVGTEPGDLGKVFDAQGAVLYDPSIHAGTTEMGWWDKLTSPDIVEMGAASAGIPMYIPDPVNTGDMMLNPAFIKYSSMYGAAGSGAGANIAKAYISSL